MSRLLAFRILVLCFVGMLQFVQSFVGRHSLTTTTASSMVRSLTPLTSSPRTRVTVVLRRQGGDALGCRLYSSARSEDNDDGMKRIVFLGTPDVAASSLQAIFDASALPGANFKIASVVTQPPKRRKRKGKLEPSPVGKMAEDLGLPVLTPDKANEKEFLDALADEVQPDLCITAAYGQYLPKRFLATPVHGTVNIHPSLLPRWRGASPVQRSLEAGDNPVGVTVLYTVSKMDAGPIVAQATHDIDENETATTVLPLLFGIGTNLLLEKLPDLLDGTITMDTATPQDEDAAVAAPLIHSSEGEFKVWQESARTCHNRLRGFSMWPGAFMYVQVGERPDIMKIKVTETRVVSDDGTTATDENVNVANTGNAKAIDNTVIRLGPTKKNGLFVTCFDGSVLELVQVQPATRKAFAARDFQNGYPGETIRWVTTPDDQAANPEKYNSRGSGNRTVTS